MKQKHHNLSRKCYNDGGLDSTLFENQIWGVDEVAHFTRYTKGTIYNLVSEGEIPFRKRRGKLWFVPNEIVCWVKGEL
jgi:excisionase family DNA binding protein